MKLSLVLVLALLALFFVSTSHSAVGPSNRIRSLLARLASPSKLLEKTDTTAKGETLTCTAEDIQDCNGEGEECDDTIYLCQAGLTCYKSEPGTNTTGICVEKVEGRSCASNSAACEDVGTFEASLACSDNVCIINYNNSLYNGDTCEGDDECRGLGDCASSTCAAEDNGDTCTSRSYCKAGSTCSGQCKDVDDGAGEGEQCDNSGDCRYPYSCNTEANKCASILSLDDGESTSSDLFCKSAASESDVCVQVPTLDGGSCSDDSDCGPGLECQCNEVSGESRCSADDAQSIKACSGKYTSWIDCRKDKGCHESSSTFIPRACANACLDKYVSLSACLFDFVVERTANSGYPEACYERAYSGASSLLAFWVLFFNN